MYFKDLNKLLIGREKQLKGYIRDRQKALKSAPDGSLRVSHGKKRIQYYQYSGSGKSQRYLNNSEQVKKLAQKDYDRKVLRAAEKELAIVQEILRTYPSESEAPENLFSLLSPEREKLAVPIELTDEDFVKQWLDYQYVGKGFPEEMPEYLTDRGERVRSKSELLIANLLARKNIPYRYECPLTLKGAGTFYPDFRILNVRLRKEFIHEHLGMMDDPEYADNAVSKLGIYISNGFFPGDRLILTAETRNHPINMTQLNRIVERYYL